MRIEQGIQPNCSELVVRLDRSPEGIREWRALLQVLERITGWKVGHVENLTKMGGQKYSVAVPVPVEKVKLGAGDPYFTLKDVPAGVNGADATEKVYNKLRYGVDLHDLIKNGFWYSVDKRLPAGLVAYKETVIARDAFLMEQIRVRKSDGYCNIGPVLMASQHCYTPHFEPLAKVVRKLGTGWHTEDGGYSEDFEDWCRNNRYEDVAEAEE